MLPAEPELAPIPLLEPTVADSDAFTHLKPKQPIYASHALVVIAHTAFAKLANHPRKSVAMLLCRKLFETISQRIVTTFFPLVCEEFSINAELEVAPTPCQG